MTKSSFLMLLAPSFNFLIGCTSAQIGTDAACPATPTAVRDICGCHPFEERTFNLLHQSRLNSDVKTIAKKCVGAGIVTDGDNSTVRTEAEGCINEESTLDEDYKKILIKIVDRGASQISAKDIERWQECRASITKKSADKFVEIDTVKEKATNGNLSEREFQLSGVDHKEGTIKFKFKSPCPDYINQNALGRLKIDDPTVEGQWCKYDAKFIEMKFDDKVGKVVDKVRLMPVYNANKEKP